MVVSTLIQGPRILSGTLMIFRELMYIKKGVSLDTAICLVTVVPI